MNVLLVITTGRTDVQLFTEEGRQEFDDDRMASIHDQLEQRTGEWQFMETPLEKVSGSAKDLPECPFQLCTPKLDSVLRYLSGQNSLPTHALLLSTRRDASADRKDPRYAGQILERRLHETLDLAVWRSTFLQGDERLEDRGLQNGVVRREVVSRIDSAVSHAIRNSGAGRVIVATTGGMPRVSSLVEEVVHLLACECAEVDFIEVADRSRERPPSADQAVPRRSVPEPAESYRARRSAIELIERGNLLAAWGAVQHLERDEVEWTRLVKWLALFASSLPLPGDSDIAVLNDSCKAVRAALRVELALRSGDIPRAAHGTVAFFESALWDHLSPHLDPKPDGKRRTFRVDPAPADKLVRSSEKNQADNLRRPFDPAEIENGVQLYRIWDDDKCGIRLAKSYFKNDHLHILGQAVSKVRALRNDVDHNEPTPELMADARHRMVEESLWSDAGNGTSRFLTQPLVQDVLRDLGCQNPESLCEDLIASVRSRLVNAYQSLAMKAP